MSAGASSDGASERLQKVLARCGHGSRREIEGWIRAGRVTVNGATAELGQRVGLCDRIRVDGRVLTLNAPNRPQTLIYHKPEGELTSRRDPQGRPLVFDRLPPPRAGRWIAVGRLDINTSGLLLLTNDGHLAERLMHPRSGIEREYAVRVFGDVDALLLERLREGVMLEDGIARFTAVAPAGGTGANTWYHVVIDEGRSREVRRLWESQGLKVSRLIRVRYGPVVLPPGLRAGRFQALTDALQSRLYEAVGLSMAPANRSGAGGVPRPAKRRRR